MASVDRETAAEAIAANIAAVRQRIARAGEVTARDAGQIALLAVGKKQSPQALRAAAAEGLLDIGENYLQEAADKMALLADLPLRWHFIGALQKNKTRPVAERFDWVHSVDRADLAQRLSVQRPAELPPLNICLQVNIDGEGSKAGVAPAQLGELIEQVVALPQLTLRGLMAIPARGDAAQRRHSFAQMQRLFHAARAQCGVPSFDILSMGMSADLEQAIAEGATLLRVGTAIFGSRQS